MPGLRVQNVSKEYNSGQIATRVLSDISLLISQGEVCALTGASGSGKSTLMNLIGLMDRPTMGDVVIDGIATRALPSDALTDLRSRTIGFVFQSFHLLPGLSALENVALPLIYRGMRRAQRLEHAKSLLDQVDLGHRLHHRPDQLSGGQCQRVAIARALAGSPQLLLADEPTGNLDSEAAASVVALFERLNTTLGLTIILVTHDPSLAARCPRRIVLRDGLIQSDGADHISGASTL